MKFVKTTVEIPDAILRRVKSEARRRGMPLSAFVAEALMEKLAKNGKVVDKPWMAGFGKLRHLRKETARINRLIEEEFERVDAAG